jgi:hypothetical protein
MKLKVGRDKRRVTKGITYTVRQKQAVEHYSTQSVAFAACPNFCLGTIAPRLSLQTTYSSTSFTHKLANKNVENTHASLRHLLPTQRSAPTRTASARRNSLCLDLRDELRVAPIRDDFRLRLAFLTRHEPSVFGSGPRENLEQ